MGFYGNITNTSKTTFSFDKTYANRYEADQGCLSDGVMSGRYILIEYDHPTSLDSYPSYYCYDGKMYSGVNWLETIDGHRIIAGPMEKNLYTPTKIGQIVQVPQGHRTADLNKEAKYAQLLDDQGTLKSITKNAYQNFLDSTYQLTGISKQDYSLGRFYVLYKHYDESTNTTTDEYRKEEAYPSVLKVENKYEEDKSKWKTKEITADMLAAHADTDIEDNPIASCKPEEVYYVYVPNDDLYAPIGRLANSYVYNNSETDRKSWSEWWNETPERQELLQKMVNTANLSDNQDKYFYQMRYSDKTDYYLPLSQIFHEITLHDDSQYTPGTYYYAPKLKDKEEPNINTQYVLDESETITPGRRYFDNGLNTEPWVSNEHLFFTLSVQEGDCVKIGAGHMYTENTTTEFWMWNGTAWDQLIGKSDSIGSASAPTNFLRNLTIDLAYCPGTSRGYDSTVWQKVFSGGTEKYVMVAELNSVVPTFDIGTDAPTMRPLVPHFDADSTNVYYKIHMQPQWGLRIKAADNTLKGPAYRQNGTLAGSQKVNLRRQSDENAKGTMHAFDNTFYPSDENVELFSREYNTAKDTITEGYYSTETEDWTSARGEEGTQVPAAIYYNKEGFDSKKIIYSGDFLDTSSLRYSADIANSGWENVDNLALTPTGQSGHLYNTHEVGMDQEPAEDTQELSIMLPSIGNTIAQIWDLVYGGRKTNAEIAKTNERNQDINWESGRSLLDRHGLRLVHDPAVTGELNCYSKAEVDTVAGAINSAHDIMGMIINEGSNTELFSHPENLLDDRIYYNADDGKYYRRHLTYRFVDLQDSDIAYDEVHPTEDDFDPSDLWIKTDDGYVKVPDDAPFDPDAEYAEKTNEVYEEINFDDFDGENYYYQEKTNTRYDLSAEQNPEMMNYSHQPTYQPGHKYCLLNKDRFQYHELSGAYKPGTYYYVDDAGSIVLDYSALAREKTKYYTINRDKLVVVRNNKTAGNFTDIYVPNYYYYIDDATGDLIKDTSSQMTRERVYYLPKISEIKEDVKVDADGNPIEDEKEWIKEISYIGISGNIEEDVFTFNQLTAFESAADKESDDIYYYWYPLEDGSYAPFKGTWEVYNATQPSLYRREIKYRQTVSTTKYTINDMDQQKLVPFTENTFYLEIKNSRTGMVTGYQPVTKEMVKPGKDLHYLAFICTIIPAGSPGNPSSTDSMQPYGVDGYPFSLAQGINYNDIEAYALKQLDDFYTSGTYHFMDLNGNIILDTYPTMTRDKTNALANDEGLIYFKIPQNAIDFASLANKKFYEPYKYYTPTSSGDYVKDVIEEQPSDREEEPKKYYERKQLYVVKDTEGRYHEGMVWPANAITVPDSVTLATHEEQYELKEIPGFARNINTMHGLLLKLNHYMEYDDKYTRDERIGNGLLNQIHDIIANIGKLKPRRFVTIDDTGRMVEADWDTRQSETAKTVKTGSLLKGIEGDQFAEVASTDAMRKQWITAHLDGNLDEPQLTIHHNFQKVKDTTSETNMNGHGDTVDLYTPIVDDMGHVVGKNIETVTLPYGFKTIKLKTPSDEITDLTADAGTMIADNTQDTLNIGAGNKWIKLASDVNSDTLTIGHTVTPFSAGLANTWYGLSVNKTIETLDADNTFEIPCFKFDEAGHITAAETHTIQLPENFETIKVTASSAVVKNVSGTAGTIVADSIKDELTFAEGNKWLNLVADTDNDTITISHYVNDIEKTTATKDLNSFSTFSVQEFGHDEAGHIISGVTTTYTLPYSFKTFTIKNGGASTATASAAATGDIVATANVDTFNIDNANKWITLAATVNGKTLKIGHAAASTAINSKGDTDAQTPTFGETFKVPYIGIDETGHVATLTDHTVKLPLLSLTKGTGDVVTGLSLTPSTGAFVETKANVGTLLISGYNPLTGVTNENKGDKATINATDSINGAFAKLQARIAVAEATHANDYLTLSNLIPVITLSEDGVLSVTNGVDTDFTINNISVESQFLYRKGTDGNEDEYKTVSELTLKVAELEARIAELEKPTEA